MSTHQIFCQVISNTLELLTCNSITNYYRLQWPVPVRSNYINLPFVYELLTLLIVFTYVTAMYDTEGLFEMKTLHKRNENKRKYNFK